MNILIVDDSPIFVRVFETYLRSLGHSTSGLTDPKNVKDHLNKNNYDVILMDIVMPDIDGITLTDQLRKNGCELPIVIVTGMGDNEELIQAAIIAGANGYVQKGRGPDEIYKTITGATKNTLTSTR